MNTPLKGILVGLGSRGHHWYNAVRSHLDTEWVGYVEPAEENRTRAMDRWGDAWAPDLKSAGSNASAPARAVYSVTLKGLPLSISRNLSTGRPARRAASSTENPKTVPFFT